MIAPGRDHVGTEPKRIGVIGGGFSGAAVVYHLARAADRPLTIRIYEPRNHAGLGIAYSVQNESLLLNVPAGKLSIDSNRPNDFLEWCRSRGHRIDGGSFLPRPWFGAYAEARMAECVANAGGRITLQHVRRTVHDVHEEGDAIVITDADETRLSVDHAVLALGHGPTRVPAALESVVHTPAVLHSPWDQKRMTHVAETADRILLVGTGLTMCDAAIMLVQMGFKGELTALSRRGLLPKAHGASDVASLADRLDDLPYGSLRHLLRFVRLESETFGWRSVIDALRPHTSGLWASLDQRDQDRFQRRLAPYWDAHRHRLPIECAAAADVLRHAGRLRIVRGYLGRVRPAQSWITCELSHSSVRGGETLHVDAIILCTGPEPDPRRWNSPLIDGLLGRGLACAEANGLGLQSTNQGLLIGSDGSTRQRISTIGPLRRGALWESTAVPEIAHQAERLSRLILEKTHAAPSPRHGHYETNA